MKRRQLLAATGLGVTSMMAGCLQEFRPARDEDDRGDTQERGSTPADDSPTPVPAGETVERDPTDGQLGGRRSPHAVFLTNPTKTERTVALAIEQGGETILDESFTVQPEGAAKVAISRFAAYTVEAAVDGSSESATETVERTQFDCNATSVQLELQADGTLSSSTLSTMMACGNVVTERVASGETVAHTVGTIEESDEMQGEHTISVSNPTDRTWTARVLLEDEEITRFDGLFTVEPDATADVRFDRNGSETIATRVLDTGASAAVDLEKKDIGACNVATTTVQLTDDGTLETSTESTDLGCQPDDA
ncbi:hypothetical protein Halru_0980 [Halovivax ruber XH-70]|uniref:Ig-like domain-containing protein n=1 Tax=Halovivax ruber (strain DSM 18193 / JCM 13892 / XH-70) TaxID=797302 RepID=L0IA40_HALRX|nr:hypothetical protein [Halovivax ruber]AGB15599.1 hypothetical protein Halru_0980 [Halovivax ruber XH-70]